MTDAGLSGRGFPSTCWSRFTGERSAEAIQDLARRYWKPIFAYIRMIGRRSDEDARDLTQQFFVWMMETDFAAKADPSRGRFRSFVKVALKNYLGEDLRAGGRLKRGGGKSFLSIEAEGAPIEVADPAVKTPEEALDALWRAELLTRAQERLQAELTRENRDLTFRVFEDYCLGDGKELNYRDLASKYGVGEGDVLNHLRHARKRFRQALRELVAETVQGETDLIEEWSALFADEKE